MVPRPGEARGTQKARSAAGAPNYGAQENAGRAGPFDCAQGGMTESEKSGNENSEKAK